MSKKQIRLMAATGLVTALLLGACSGSKEAAPAKATEAPKAAATEAPKAAATEAPKAATPATTPAAAAAAAVNVALKEFTFEGPATVKAGEVSFAAKNGGAAPHELVIVKSDGDPKKLAVKDGSMDESVTKPIARTKQLAAGASETLSVKLEAGKYALVCNVPGHFSLGMAVPFTVN